VQKKLDMLSDQMDGIRLAGWQAHAIAAATKLGIAEALADGSLLLYELAERTHTHAPTLYRLLRALQTIGFFKETTTGMFANTTSSERLRRGEPGSLYAYVLRYFSNVGGQWQAWDALAEAVRTGSPAFDKVHGYSLYEVGRRNPEASELFNESMRATSALITPVIAAAYDWGSFPTIVDVGGGSGSQLVAILDSFPECNGVLFDQPQLADAAIVHPRMKYVSGDFFYSVPSNADAYFLRWILHNWQDDQVLEILRVVHRSMKKTARLVLAEAIVSKEPSHSSAKWSDLLMLIMLGGRERTEDEYCSLLSKAGFRLDRIVETNCSLSLLIAMPR
jgi:hypothetical protein